MFGNWSGNRERSNRISQSIRRSTTLSAEVVRLATLERRELMTVTGTDFSGTEGIATAATTQVATFNLDGGLIGNNAGDFSATVFWGDGTSSIGTVQGDSGNYTVQAGHTYAIGASYTFQVVVNGKQGTQQTGNGTATIGDIPIVSTANPIVNGALDPKFSVTAFFTDAYPGLDAGSYVASVNWGDGTTTSGTVSGSGGAFTVTTDHTYTANGSFPVNVSLTRKLDGQSVTSASTNAIVMNAVATPQPVMSSVTINAVAGTAFTGNVATFTDAYPGAVASDYTALITWKPGVVTSGTVEGSNGSFVVKGSYTFDSVGNYPVKIDLTRSKGNGAGTTTSNAIITATAQPAMSSVTINAVANTVFTGNVATFTDAYPGAVAGDYTALITWKPGVVTSGTVEGSNGSFVVKGSYTFDAVGNYPVKIDLARAKGNGTSSVTSTAIVLAIAQPQLSGLTINPVVSMPFSGIVANFTDLYPGIAEGDYDAKITWQPGVVTDGTVKGSNGSFSITPKLPYTYNSSGTFAVQVELTRKSPFTKVSTTSAAIVSTPVVEVFGALSPASDTGMSNQDGITNINRPTFNGTAPVGSTVQLLVQWYGQNDQVQVGQGLVDSTGRWSIQTVPLVDGVYSIFVRVVSSTGQITSVMPLVGSNQVSSIPLVIDTIAPVIASGLIDRNNRRVVLSFRDNLSGMDKNSVENTNNYNLFGPHPYLYTADSIYLLKNTSILTSDPMISSVNIAPNSPGKWKVNGIRVLSGGIQDVAGNALDGDFKRSFPTGNGRPGGLFYWKFSPAISNQTNSPVRKFGPTRRK